MADAPHVASRIDSCQLVEVIRVEFIRGCGQSMSDPVRQVEAYYTQAGELIVERDPEFIRKIEVIER